MKVRYTTIDCETGTVDTTVARQTFVCLFVCCGRSLRGFARDARALMKWKIADSLRVHVNSVMIWKREIVLTDDRGKAESLVGERKRENSFVRV